MRLSLWFERLKGGRPWLAEEIVQTSSMDCGPAALVCWLNSAGIPTNYGRLRESCQTDVDGTSIDAMEELAIELGLAAEQVMLPAEAIFARELPSMPGIAVVLLPNRLTHFVVVWRELFGWVQVMDPAQGRIWLRKAQLLDRLFEHRMPVAKEDWFAYATSDEFLALLRDGAMQIGIAPAAIEEMARQASDWHALAALDASVRCALEQSRTGTRLKPQQCLHLVRELTRAPEQIPAACWQVREVDHDNVLLTGVVLLRQEVAQQEVADQGVEAH